VKRSLRKAPLWSANELKNDSMKQDVEFFSRDWLLLLNEKKPLHLGPIRFNQTPFFSMGAGAARTLSQVWACLETNDCQRGASITPGRRGEIPSAGLHQRQTVTHTAHPAREE